MHFVKTHNYVQVTGVGNFTKINVRAGDAGGELDNRGADGALIIRVRQEPQLMSMTMTRQG